MPRSGAIAGNGRSSGLLDGEARQRLLARGAVHAYARFLQHPATRLGVEIGEIAKRARGQEVALDVLDTRLDDPFLGRIGGRTRVDLEAVALGALGIRALHQRVARTRLGDRALGVVDDEARRHRGEPLEGAAMAAEPCGHRLIPDELDVLMTREAQRHHEAPGAALLAARRIEQERTGAEIDLRGFARAELQTHRGFSRTRSIEHREHAPHGRVAAAVAVLATQRGMDRHAAHALLGPAGDALAKRLDAGNGAARPARLADRRRDHGVLGQRRVSDQPAMPIRQRTQCRDLGPAHQPRPRNVAVGIALAQTHQDRSILEHLESPAPHR